jgi:hypothetical protein
VTVGVGVSVGVPVGVGEGPPHGAHALVTVATGFPLITDTDLYCPANDTYHVPVAAAENTVPVKVVQLQKSGLSPVTVADAEKPQASSKVPPKPIKNDSVEVGVGV